MKLHSIETGMFKLDGGAMFGVVPKSIWSKTNPADHISRELYMSLASALVGSLLLIMRPMFIKRVQGDPGSSLWGEILKFDLAHSILMRELLFCGSKECVECGIGRPHGPREPSYSRS